MSRTETLDNTKMTNGPITRILLSFAGPVLLGQLLQQLYNIADAAIVGQFLSSRHWQQLAQLLLLRILYVISV